MLLVQKHGGQGRILHVESFRKQCTELEKGSGPICLISFSSALKVSMLTAANHPLHIRSSLLKLPPESSSI
jgi:hypothetical protein